MLEGVHSSSPTVMPGSGHLEVSELNIFYVAIIETNQEVDISVTIRLQD